MRPDDVAALGDTGRRDEFGPADLLVALRRELGNDQVPRLAGEEVAITVLGDEDVAPFGALARSRGVGLPLAVPRLEFDAAKLPFRAIAVHVAAIDERGAHGAEHTFVALAFPKHRGGRFAF